jgi:hypothetical protein
MERLDISKLNRQQLLDYKRCIEATIISRSRRMGITIPFKQVLEIGDLLFEINKKLNGN